MDQLPTTESTIDQVYAWALQFGPDAANKLKQDQVDGAALYQLTYQDFYSMHIPAGPRRKIINALDKKRNDPPSQRSFIPWDTYKPWTKLKGILSPEEAEKAIQFYNSHEGDFNGKGTDYGKMVFGKRVHLPQLEAKLEELFPDMMIFSCHYFNGGKATGAQFSGWHTGVNLSKLFVGYPETFSVWVPLQSLTTETAGRLWFYTGEYLDSMIDLLTISEKKTMVFQYLMLSLVEKELEAHKETEDCHFGDGFHFWEWHPHCVDTDCKILDRQILSFRLVKKGAVVDQPFLDLVANHPEGVLDYNLEEKKHFNALSHFLTQTKSAFEASLEIQKQRAEEAAAAASNP